MWSKDPNFFIVMVKNVNLKYLHWKKIDKMLVCWLLASIFEEIFPVISKCHVSLEIWDLLEKEFISVFKTHLLHVKNLL